MSMTLIKQAYDARGKAVVTWFKVVFILVICCVFVAPLHGHEMYHEVGVQQRQFVHEPSNALQKNSYSALSLNSFYSHSDNDQLWAAELWLRADQHDKQRNHVDIRELYWLHYADQYEWQVGIARVFWGVTESAHLVDVINQTDYLEGLDGEDKLGQGMLHYTQWVDSGQVEFFVLPHFNPRDFYGEQHRFALGFDVNQHTIYQSSAKQHIDLALRISQTWQDLDWSINGFRGTNRDVQFLPSDNGMTAYYGQMEQLGATLQYLMGAWIIKGEFLLRRTLSDPENQVKRADIRAFVAGFEYSQIGLFDSQFDLGYLLEYQYDSRSRQQVLGQNDVFAGMRLALNDADSSEIIFGLLHDLSDHSQNMRLEGSMRLGEQTKIEVAAYKFKSKGDNYLQQLENQDVIELNLYWYFSH